MQRTEGLGCPSGWRPSRRGWMLQQFIMPEGIAVQLTIGRAVDAAGNVHIEGKGVAPTLRVPVTVATIQERANGGDPVLSAAEQILGATP